MSVSLFGHHRHNAVALAGFSVHLSSFKTAHNHVSFMPRWDRMRILIAYFSRTGSTQKLAAALADELRSRGHAIEFEVIKPAVYCCLIREVSRDFPRYPSMLFSLASSSWRRHHIETYNQVEQDLQSLKYPDVSEFDRICIGGTEVGAGLVSCRRHHARTWPLGTGTIARSQATV